jgi:putative nucleotidyltransferase with HDIG domain
LITTSEVRELLEQRAEDKNLDYKESMNWEVAAADEKAAIVKDTLAMSNTQGGGNIVFGVRDHDSEAVCLTESDYHSFDTTRFADFLNRYADPPVGCRIHKFIIEGRRFVTIEVPEFNDVPIICKADLNDAKNRLVLKRGAIYIRTERASSEIVSTAESMRDLVDRAVVRRGDHLLETFEQLMKGKHVNKHELSDLERSYDITIEALADAFDLKEGTTQGHAKRVTVYTIALARAMGVPKDEILMISRGAFLHDIGKMAVPNEILRKPAALTLDEFAIVKEHCLKGYKVVHKVPFLKQPAEIVYSHHERYDGSGYPRGLKEKGIPLGARIVAVANALDSITSDQPYRRARSIDAARKEVELWAGRQFDPEVVQVFLEMPKEIWPDLAREIDSRNTND